jgi:hypothetical protein
MSSIYTYMGYGLKIRSEIQFPEFVAADFEESDVRISLKGGLVGSDTSNNWEQSYSRDTESGTFFQVSKVARYLVRDGNRIDVDPMEGGDPGAVRLFLLSNAMAIMLIQRGKILLHASAIRNEQGLVVFMGDSGAGKSSMLVELLRRGHPPFSDDVIVLEEDPSTGEVIAIPSYPMIKLWKETRDALGVELVGEGHQLRKGVEKFGHFFHNQFRQEPMRIAKVIVIEKDPGIDTYQIRKPGGLDSFEILSRNIYRRQYIQEDNLRKKHLLLLGKLLAQVPVRVIRRPAAGGSIEKFADFSEHEISSI